MKEKNRGPSWAPPIVALAIGILLLTVYCTINTAELREQKEKILKLEQDVELLGAGLRVLDQRLNDTALCWPVLP